MSEEVKPQKERVKRASILTLDEVASITKAVKSNTKAVEINNKPTIKKINKLRLKSDFVAASINPVPNPTEVEKVTRDREHVPNHEIQSIQQVINESHPDIRRFFNHNSVKIYKATADGLIITLDNGTTILIAQWKNKKKHYIVKQDKHIVLDRIG